MGEMRLDREPSDLIAQAVRASGLSKARPEDIEFYVQAHRAEELNWRAIRKRGNPASPGRKQRLGVEYRGILSNEFLDTLNETGLLDPVESANTICRYACGLISTAASIVRARDAGIDLFRFRASNMAAGPCPKAAALDEARIPLEQIELIPFPECTRPGQCACLYQAWLSIGDERDF
jgi:hypothetical protein